MQNKDQYQPIVLFDGVCNFCNSSVNYILKHDAKNKFLFSPLQSEVAKLILERYSTASTKMINSIVLIESNKMYTKSTAVLRISKNLNGLHPILYILILVPSFIRNLVYNFVARNRYKWFGKKEVCMMPTDEVKARFLVYGNLEGLPKQSL